MYYVVKFNMASDICYLIFIGSLTVRFDLSDYNCKLLVIGTIRFKHFVIDTIIKD